MIWGAEWRRIAQRLRIIRACPGECPGGRFIAAEAGVIGVVGINVSPIFATDGDHNIVKNGDRIGGENLCAVAAKRDVRNEVKLTIASRRVKFQRRISRERAAADIKYAVSAKH